MASEPVQLEKRGQIEKAVPRGHLILDLWTNGRTLWAGMSSRQQGWAAASVLLILILLGAVGWGTLRTDWRVLYSNFDPEDARQVGLALTQAQIPFDISDNGTTLRVPSPMLDKARLSTSSKAVKSGRIGFELFDKPNWVGSEFDQQVNYQRALEGELEHTVSSLSDIDTARVHLVMAHESLFSEQQRPAKASVVLKLRHASLAEGEADAIRNLVSSAVDGLSPDHVVLVDAAGRLSLGPKTQESLKLSAEQALEDKILTTIGAVTGPENVRATVTLDYETNSSDETSETYDPDNTVTLSMERTEQTSGQQAVPTGVPGTASNAPISQAIPVYPKQTTEPQTSRTEAGTYGVSKTVKHRVETPGKLRRMTVAVVVNDHQAGSPEKGSQKQWQPRSAEELRSLTSLAQAAAGFDAARGDVVTLQAISFEGNRDQVERSFAKRAFSAIQEWPEAEKYATLLLAVIIVVAFGIRPGVRQLATIRNPQVSQSTLEPLVDSPLLAPVPPEYSDPGRLRTQELLEKVTGQMKKEPTQSSRLIQSWIHSE